MLSFSGKLVGLRALEPEDLEILYRWENDPEIWSLGQTLKPFSKDTLRRYLESSHLDIHETRQVRFVIQKLDEIGIPVGLIDLFDFDPHHQRAGVGILIGNPAERGKGYASDALLQLMEYAFKHLLLHQLYCTIPASNLASIQLFQKTGFQRTGIRKEWLYTNQGWEDEEFYQFTRTEWESSKL